MRLKPFGLPVLPRHWCRADNRRDGWTLISHSQDPWRVRDHDSPLAVCLDICANHAGAPIYACARGVPRYVTVPGTPAWTRAGWYVEIVHTLPDGVIYYTSYSHLHERPAVTIGEEVAAGACIGVMGSTGKTGGPHLHLEIARSTGPDLTDRERLLVYQTLMEGIES